MIDFLSTVSAAYQNGARRLHLDTGGQQPCHRSHPAPQSFLRHHQGLRTDCHPGQQRTIPGTQSVGTGEYLAGVHCPREIQTGATKLLFGGRRINEQSVGRIVQHSGRHQDPARALQRRQYQARYLTYRPNDTGVALIQGNAHMPILKRDNKPDLYYEIDDYTDPWKQAPYILLQHGYGRSTKFWHQWIPYLSRFYKVVRADLRGLGQSAKNFDLEKDLNPEAYMDDLAAILDVIGAESVHYCGESLGGILGMLFAAKCPQRVRSLSLISTPVFLDTSFQTRQKFGFASWEEALRKLGARGYAQAKNGGDRFSPGTNEGLMQWFAEEQGKSDVEVLIAMQKIATRINATSYLERITAPVLSISPSNGPITTPEQEALMRKHVHNLQVVHLPSNTHNLHCTQPAACATHVLHFVAQQDGTSCRE